MGKKYYHPDQETYHNFRLELQRESDRGAAIMACTMLDWCFKKMLSNFLVNSKTTEELLNQPNLLSSLSAKIKLSYSIGLITSNELHDCEILRKIRNDFAHRFEIGFSFEDSRIKKLCANLYIKEDIVNGTIYERSREVYINNALVMIMCLFFRKQGKDDCLEEEQNI